MQAVGAGVEHVAQAHQAHGPGRVGGGEVGLVEGDVFEHRARKQVLVGQAVAHGGGQRVGAQVGQGHPGVGHLPGVAVEQAGQQAQQGGFARAVGPHQGQVVAGGHPEAHPVEYGARGVGVAVAEAAHVHGQPGLAGGLGGGPGGGQRGGAGGGGHGFEVEHVAHLVERRQGVVHHVNLKNELFDRPDGEDDDDFSGHELADVNLLGNEQPATDAQQGGRNQGFEHHEPPRLGDQHPEVGVARAEVAVKQVVGAAQGQPLAPGQPKAAHRAGHVFEPGHHAVLVLALGDARAQAPGAGHGYQGVEQQHQQQPEGDEDGMIKGEQHQPEQDLQARGRKVYQHGGQALLQGGHVEQAVHELGQVLALQGLGAHPGQAHGEVEGHPRHEPLLDVLDQVQLHNLQPPHQGRAHHDEADEHHQRGAHGPAAHKTDDRLHAQRQTQADDAGQRGVHVEVGDIAAFGRQQPKQALDGGKRSGGVGHEEQMKL